MPKGTRPGPYALLVKYREIGLLLIVLLLIAAVGLRNPSFATPANLLFILEDTAILAILAAGMLCVLLVGSIDISISAIMALCAMTVGLIMRDQLTGAADGARQSLPLVFLLLIGVGTGAAIGLLNGAIIAYGGVLPIVTTLGMQYLLYGLNHILSGGSAIYRKDMSDAFFQFTGWSPWGWTARHGSCWRFT
jgi:rhamnose transport system permease protein